MKIAALNLALATFAERQHLRGYANEKHLSHPIKPRGADSFSRKLSTAIVEKLKAKNPGIVVNTHDICKNPTPHLEEAHLAAFFTPPENHNEQNKEAVRNSDASVNEVMAADAIVIGVPMWNFSIPSALKAWIDHLARAGKTFRYTATGPEGLVRVKKFTSRSRLVAFTRKVR